MPAADERYYYEPRDGHGLPHDPFNAIVGPRPIGWISSQDAEGRRNLAPYSFFNAFNYKPPLIGFSSIGYKDTVRNIEQTGEFAWNLVTGSLAAAMNASCAPVGPDVDEFLIAGVTPAPSRRIKAPRVLESPVSFECRLTQSMRLQDQHEQQLDTWMVFGEVIAVHIDPSLLRDGIYQTAAADPVLRAGGPGDYYRVAADTLFRLFRPFS